MDFAPDTAKMMHTPHEIQISHGPCEFDDDWSKHWLEAQEVKADLEVPWNTSASEAATQLYARFSKAAESYLLSTFPLAESKHFGRGSQIKFSIKKASIGNDLAHIYATPTCSYWEQLGAKIRIA